MNEFCTSAVCGSNVARFFIITYAHGKLKIGGFEKLSFFESTNFQFFSIYMFTMLSSKFLGVHINLNTV